MLTRGYHELILPRVIADHVLPMSLYSASCVAVDGLLVRYLLHHKHRRVAKLWLTGEIAQDGFWGVHNLTLKAPK